MAKTRKIGAVKGLLDGFFSGLSFHLVVDVFPVSDRNNQYFFSLIVDMTNYPVVPDPVSPVICKVSCKSFSGIAGFRGKSDHVHQVGDLEGGFPGKGGELFNRCPGVANFPGQVIFSFLLQRAQIPLRS